MTFTGAELFLRICWVDSKGKAHSGYYLLERLPEHKLAWRLRKPLAEDQEDPDKHTVMLLKSGKATCDCQSATFSAHKQCKHVSALLDRGLLPRKIAEASK